ncbi:alpha/beta fold hydrolase [Methylocystis sp. IM3]|uniref:alpha/beta fold hydrolase n=1 Tax=unclassified Methylocystis TaxID=2625913 RepID=UPI0030FC39F8
MAFHDWTRDFTGWPLASLEFWRRLFEVGAGAVPESRPPPQWATPARLALDLAALRLWDFSTGNAARPVVVLAPFALHDAQIADLAPGHSLISALLRHGCPRLFLIEWKSATRATCRATTDDLLAALNVAIDDVGAPVDLVGLCQGGWLSLVYAARFPAKAARIVLVGTPVDVRAAPSALSEPVASTCEEDIRRLIDMGGGCVRGERMATVWPREDDEEKRLVDSLEIDPPFAGPEAQQAIAAFRDWDRRPLDLPGPYFQEVFSRLYRDNLLASGGFPALGRSIDLRALRQPLFLLIGERDAIAPPAQALAVTRLAQGRAETAQAPCSHLALFMGRRTIETQWPRVAAWLEEARR